MITESAILKKNRARTTNHQYRVRISVAWLVWFVVKRVTVKKHTTPLFDERNELPNQSTKNERIPGADANHYINHH